MNNIEKSFCALKQVVRSATSDEREARILMVRARNLLSHSGIAMTAANRKKQQELSAEIAEYLHRTGVSDKNFAAALTLNEFIASFVHTVAERLNKNIVARVRAILK